MAHHLHRIDEIDDQICARRQLYLKAVWAEHEADALYWAAKVDELLDMRNRVQRGEE